MPVRLLIRLVGGSFLGLLLLIMAPSVVAAATPTSHDDGSYGSAAKAPTGSKPESKLWFNDGTWWAAMWSDSGTPGIHVWRYNSGSDAFTPTSTVLDTRSSALADTLADGSTTWVATHVFAADSNSNAASTPSRFYKLNYNSSTQTYSVASGFPTNINTVSSETLVFDKAADGTFWATWTQAKKVYVAHSDSNGGGWATSQLATGLNSDDISSVIRFGGNKIGVMWSDQAAETGSTATRMLFAVHADGGSWGSPEVAASGDRVADDHINLKTDGTNVYAAVKTSLNGGSSPNPNDPILRVMTRSSGGTWSYNTIAIVSSGDTRPIVDVDTTNGKIYALWSSSESGGTILYRVANLGSNPMFGGSNNFVSAGSGGKLNNATSSKGSVGGATAGYFLVEAADDTTKHYWHGKLSTGGGSGNTAPTAQNVSVSTTHDQQAPVTLTGTDTGTCELTFAIVTQPAHGTLGTPTNNVCTAGSPNTDTQSLTYTPTAGYVGGDSFTYTVNDGTSTSSAATVTVTVSDATPAAQGKSVSTAQDTPVDITLTATDADAGDCPLTLNVPSTTSHGSLALKTAASCSTGTTSAVYTYTPSSGYNGPDSFQFTASDGIRTSTSATVSIGVGNVPPTANDASKTTNQDTPVSITLSGSDPETCNLTFAVSSPAHGSLGSVSTNPCSSGNPNTDSASVTYTPDSGFTGSDSFTYTVSDGSNTSSPATVSITVNAVSQGGSATFNPTADAEVYSSSVNSNHGTTTSMKARLGDGTSASPSYNDYLKFNVQGISGTVQSVKLRLYVATAANVRVNVVNETDNTWTETGITYANAPTPGGTVLGFANPATAGAYVEFTLDPSSVSGNGTVSFVVLNTTNTSVVFNSKEASANKPELVVTYG